MLGPQPGVPPASEAPWALPSVDDNKDIERDDIRFDESPPDARVTFLADGILGRPPGYASPSPAPPGPKPGFVPPASSATVAARRPLPRLPPGSSAPAPGGAPFCSSRSILSVTLTDGKASSLSFRSDSPRSSCSTPSGSGARAARALSYQSQQSQSQQNLDLLLFDTGKDEADMMDEGGGGAGGGGAAGQSLAPRPPAPRRSWGKPPASRRSPTPTGAGGGGGGAPAAGLAAPPSPTPDASAPRSGAASPVGSLGASGGAGPSSLPPRGRRSPLQLSVQLPFSLPEDDEMVPGDPPHLLSSPATRDVDAAGGRDTPYSPDDGGAGPPLFDWGREEAEGEEFSENALIAGALNNTSLD